jgi:hypothetical protein
MACLVLIALFASSGGAEFPLTVMFAGALLYLMGIIIVIYGRQIEL